MGRLDFTRLFQVIKALNSAITKNNSKVVVVSDKVEDDTVIQFKNGSYIKVVTPKENVRGNRAKLYPRPSEDFMPDWCVDKEILDEVLTPFCTERESNNMDGQLLYVSGNNGKLDKTTLSNIVNEEFREQYDTFATFHDVINYLLFSVDEISEREVVHCLSALSDLIVGLEQERIDKLNNYAEKLFGGRTNEL